MLRRSEGNGGPCIAAESDAGRVREPNEDCVGTPRRMGTPDHLLLARGTLLAVADGMGGHAAGEVASQHAVEVLYSTYYTDPSPGLADSLRRAVERANAEIYALGSGGVETLGLGTTMVAALLIQDDLIVANVGDSRAYLVRRGRARQVSRDHSWVAESLRAGLIDEQQAREHTLRNVITRCLGEKPTVEVDLFQERLLPGDAVVLCSDGLTNKVDEGTIAEVVERHPPAKAAATLVGLANDLGGHDNISVLLARVPAAKKVSLVPWVAAASAAGLILVLAIGLLAGNPGPSLQLPKPTAAVLDTARPTEFPTTEALSAQPPSTPVRAVLPPPAGTSPSATWQKPAGSVETTEPWATTASPFNSPLDTPSPVALTATLTPIWDAPMGPVHLPLEWGCSDTNCSRTQAQKSLAQILGYHPWAWQFLPEMNRGPYLVAKPRSVLRCAFGPMQRLVANRPDPCFAVGDTHVQICGSGLPETGITVMVLGRLDGEVLDPVAMLYWEGEDPVAVKVARAPQAKHVWFLGQGCEASPHLKDYALEGQPFLVYSFWGRTTPQIPGEVKQASPAIFVWNERQRSYLPWEDREGNP